MKKISLILLVIVMVLSLTACAGFVQYRTVFPSSRLVEMIDMQSGRMENTIKQPKQIIKRIVDFAMNRSNLNRNL